MAVQKTNPQLLRAALAHDLVYYRSSRMVELLIGQFLPDLEYSLRADWVPSIKRPFYAAYVNHATLVAWQCSAPAATAAKSKHFKSIVARAAEQLPGDTPRVIHVGYESVGKNALEAARFRANEEALVRFDPKATNLRWVYAHYLSPEYTTRPMESWAVSETMAKHRIGRHRMAEPLPDQLLLDDRPGVSGAHWLPGFPVDD